MKISQMNSTRSGRPVANQFIITEKGGIMGNFVERETFQSYQTTIAQKTYWQDGTVDVVLDQDSWDYSRTTGKYRNQFLAENTAETKRKIKEGIYKLGNLN